MQKQQLHNLQSLVLSDLGPYTRSTTLEEKYSNRYTTDEVQMIWKKDFWYNKTKYIDVRTNIVVHISIGVQFNSEYQIGWVNDVI